MTRLQLTTRSQTLAMQVTMTFLTPARITPATRVLWLLHGYSDSDVTWCENTALVPLVADRNLVVVMPHGYNRYYSDARDGSWPLLTALESELFPAVQALLHLPTDAAHNVIAGQSMGGYGALKLALRHPERYAKACALSGALDIEAAYASDWVRVADFLRLFGPRAAFAGSADDLFHLLAHTGGRALPLRLVCGAQDRLLPDSQRLAARAQALGQPCTLTVAPGGHDWAFWAQQLPALLDWAMN